MKTNDKISNALNMSIEPEIVDADRFPTISEENQLPAIPEEIDVLFQGDFDKVRKNIEQAVELGKSTLEEMTHWASQAQNNFAYTALASFLASYVKTNEALLNIHKVKRDIAPTVARGNTNVLIVTTADLLRLMKQANNAA
jgi:hypothetical protein